MNRVLKILILSIAIFCILFAIFRSYLSYRALKKIDRNNFHTLITKIESTSALPKNFKTTYGKVYPDVFENSMTKSALAALFNREMLPCPSRFIANDSWHLIAGSSSNFGRKLNYLGFVWLLEEEVTQEQCFVYYLSHFDFLHNTKGPHEAAQFYYHKLLNGLDLDEQLGLILKIENAAYFDETRHPERCAARIKELKKQWTEN